MQWKSEIYEHDATLRGEDTMNFYRHLDINACLWSFVAYVDLSQIETCGASITTEGEVQKVLTT